MPHRSKEIFGVWLLARPLKLPNMLSSASIGKLPVCHWAILITPMSEDYIREKLRTGFTYGAPALGTLYELTRVEVNSYLNMVEDFSATNLRGEWSRVSGNCIGTTTMSNEAIKDECTILYLCVYS
jgi:hypothetical protein